MRRENVYFMVIRCASKMGEKGWKLGENGTFGQNVQTRNDYWFTVNAGINFSEG